MPDDAKPNPAAEIPLPTLDNPLAEKTFHRITAALEEGKTTCVAEIVRMIKEMASKYDTIIVQELADMIGRDVTLTAKVISSANMLGYNPTGVQVTTITEAIHIVGFHTIRNLAISIMLAENAGEGLYNPEDKREVAALALCSGILAERLTHRLRPQDAEFAFVCAALRNYGRLVLSTFLTTEYRQAQELCTTLSEHEAFKRIFGLSPIDLGRLLLHNLSLPMPILQCVQDSTEQMLRNKNKTREEEIIVIAEFAVRLCEAADDVDISTEDFDQRVDELLAHYALSPKTEKNTIGEMLCEVTEILTVFNKSNNASVMASSLFKKIKARATRNYTPPAECIAETHFQDQTPPPAVETVAKDVFPDGIVHITEAMSQPTIDLRAILQLVTDTLYEGLVLDTCMAFMRDSATHLFAARTGHGTLFKSIQDRPLISAADKTLFGVCLTRGEDMILQNAVDSKIRPFVPEWLSSYAKSRNPSIFLPIKGNKNVFSLICCICKNPGVFALTPYMSQQLKVLRMHVVLAKRLADAQT